MDLHAQLDHRAPVAETARGCPEQRKGGRGQQQDEGSVQESDDLLQVQVQPRHTASNLLFSLGDGHDLEVHRNGHERKRGLRETCQLQGLHHHERQPSAIDTFDDRMQGLGYDLNYADYNMGGSYTMGSGFDVRVEGDGSYGSRVIRRDGFVALLLSAYDASEMDQLDDSSHVRANADDDREYDYCGESIGDEELYGDELRDDGRSEDVLSGDERSGDELIGDEQFRDEQVDDEQDEHGDGHPWSSGRELSQEYEQHLNEAAEKILRQTPKNSIDVLVLYRRLLRYRRLRMLPRAVACALAMQVREEQKEILRSEIPDIRFNINRLSEKDCIDRFRFRKVQLAYLLMQFRMPAFFPTEEGYRVSSTEALCITFERMGHPSRWREQVNKFGRSESNLSSIFYYVCEHIAARCVPLLRGDWDRVSTRLEDFASAIHAKGAALDNLWGFIDGTVRNICRPGDSIEQRAMYNGHKRSHAVKYQAVTTPDGIIVHMFGPGQGRAHDLTLLDGSALKDIISRDHRFRGYLLYGDPAYGQTYVFASPFDKVGATSEELAVNKSLSSVRIAVEWGFGQIIAEWALLDFKRKMSIGNVPVGMLYEVTAIFANCVTIARHQNVISSYFDVPPPTFAEYFAGLD